MKKMIAFLLLVGSLFSLTACEDDMPYKIYEEKGKFYMDLRELEMQEKTDNASGHDFSIMIPGRPEFSSVAEMKQRVLSGTVAPEDIDALREFYATDGVWEICDMNNLFDVKMPDGVSVKSVTLSGTTYHISANCDISETCGIKCYPQEQYLTYKERFQEEYTGFPDLNTLQEVTWYEEIEERNATQTFYQNDTGSYKVIKYKLEKGERIFFVLERYCLARYQQITGYVPSETVPQRVEVFMEKNGEVFAYIRLLNPTERPSVDWITSFDLVPLDG